MALDHDQQHFQQFPQPIHELQQQQQAQTSNCHIHRHPITTDFGRPLHSDQPQSVGKQPLPILNTEPNLLIDNPSNLDSVSTGAAKAHAGDVIASGASTGGIAQSTLQEKDLLRGNTIIANNCQEQQQSCTNTISLQPKLPQEELEVSSCALQCRQQPHLEPLVHSQLSPLINIHGQQPIGGDRECQGQHAKPMILDVESSDSLHRASIEEHPSSSQSKGQQLAHVHAENPIKGTQSLNFNKETIQSSAIQQTQQIGQLIDSTLAESIGGGDSENVFKSITDVKENLYHDDDKIMISQESQQISNSSNMNNNINSCLDWQYCSPKDKIMDLADLNNTKPFGLNQSINIRPEVDPNDHSAAAMVTATSPNKPLDRPKEITSTCPVSPSIKVEDKLNSPKRLPSKTNEISIKTDPISDLYNLEARPFARGKFAQVKRCVPKDNSTVCYAAKCIKKRRRQTDIRDEIMLEIEALKLSYETKHIVKLYEVYETSSEMILLLEMARGGELQRVLDNEEQLEEPIARRFIGQILEGLSFLHDNQIAHLDIKPQNLLLTEPFPDGDIKLCDFGISRRITEGCEIRDICGTPDYVAPEILRYDPISLATDMWSLGVLTYVLLSGYSPFGSENKQQTFCNITQGALDFPSEIFAKISQDAIDFMKKLIVREPLARMTSKEAIQHAWLVSSSSPALPAQEMVDKTVVD